MNVLNVCFGLFLIKVIKMGVAGAACGLLISRALGLVICAAFIVRKSNPVRITFANIKKFSLGTQKKILNLGVPTSVESVLFNIGKLITQIYIVSLGPTAQAANAIGGSIFGLVCVPGNSFSTGVMILTGQKIGRGEKDDVPKTIRYGVLTAMGLMAVICLGVLFAAPVIKTLYSVDFDTWKILRMLIIASIIIHPILWPASFILPSALRATGDVRFTMVVAVASMWVFRIGTGYVLGITLGMGVMGVWIGMYTDWVIRGLLFFVRLAGGKWKTKNAI